MALSRREILKSAAAAAAAGGLAPIVSACTNAGRGGERPAGALPEPQGIAVPDAALVLRPAEARGHADHGWLDTRHSFSFASYYDPEHMGFRRLRVINEDRVTPGDGFPTHPHRDMEIVTYVLEGALEHKDSMGNGSIIRPGEVQRMTAGTGVTHSEVNPSRGEGVHFLQIWIEPTVRGAVPSYDQRVYPQADRTNRLRLVASPDGRDGSIEIKTDTGLLATTLEPGRSLSHAVPAGRFAWLQVARGTLVANGYELKAGDGLAAAAAGLLEMKATGKAPAEVLLFDLA